MQQPGRSRALTEEIQYFTLDGLFPQNHVFAYHHPLGILTHLSCAKLEPHPLLLAQQRFVGRECDLLLALLTSYPQMAPYEVLHVSFSQGFAHLTEHAVVQAKQRLDKLRAGEGLWNAEIKPLRKVMAQVRFRLQEVNLDTSCLIETGYVLTGGKELKWRRSPDAKRLHQAPLQQFVNHG